MKKITPSLLLLLLLIQPTLHAQQWTNTLNGGGNGMDAVNAMVVDKSGNVYITGYAFNGTSDNDYVTIKYNTNGVQQWKSIYNGPGNGSDIPSAIFVDNSGNVFVTGSSDGLAGTFIDMDAATVKYNAQGVQQWVARFDGGIQRNDAGVAVKSDASGNVFITGSTTVHNGAYTKLDYLTVKYNASGVQQWKSTYNGPANDNDAAVGIALDPNGNVYVTGTSSMATRSAGLQDYVTIKYNGSGVQQWAQRYNGPANRADYASAIAADNAGNVYVTGYSLGNDLDFATIKYNTNGVQQWLARYDGPAHGGDLAYALVLDAAGNVYVTGSDQKTLYNSDYLTVKYNNAGVQQWTARYAGSANDNDEARALALDKSGNVYVTGYINGVSPSWDIATVKYNSSGVQQWVNKYDGPKDSADVGNAIGVDDLGNVYVAGASTGTKSAWDFVTLKYASTTQTAAKSTDIILNAKASPEPGGEMAFAVYQNFPNPFRESTTIRYVVPGKPGIQTSRVSLVVYNIQGIPMSTLVDSDLPAGIHEAVWNTGNAASGVYLYKVSTAGHEEVKKMILVR